MKFLELLATLRTPFFDKAFLSITALGGEMVFIAVAVIIFWCVSKKNGYFLLSVGFVGMVVNQFLKISFRILRPWDLNPHFEAVEAAMPDAGGFSFPSGHTQNSVGVFGSIFSFSKNKLIKVLCLILCLIIPFSRMYLGVHTPLDVFFSFFFAIFLIIVIKPIFEFCYKKTLRMYLFLGFMAVISIFFVVYVQFIFDPSVLDEGQMHNYTSALKNAYLIFGAIIGVLIALPIERYLVRFNEGGKWYTQAFKVSVGLILVLGLLEGLKLPLNALLPENTIARALRYGLVVVFVIAIYPISFKWFKKLEDKIERKRLRKRLSQKNNSI